MNPAAASDSSPTLADRALERLRDLPALQACSVDGGMAMGVGTGSVHIVHLHQPDEARLCLTRPVIDRLSGALAESGQVRAEPDSDWVVVRLDSDGDIALLMSLVSVAIQANS